MLGYAKELLPIFLAMQKFSLERGGEGDPFLSGQLCNSSLFIQAGERQGLLSYLITVSNYYLSSDREGVREVYKCFFEIESC